MDKKLGKLYELIDQHIKAQSDFQDKVAEQLAEMIDAIDCHMETQEAIPSGKSASSYGEFSHASEDEAVNPKESLGNKVECFREEVREDRDHHIAQLQEQISMLQHQLAAANEKLKENAGEAITTKTYSKPDNEGRSPKLSDQIHELSEYLKTCVMMDMRTFCPGTRDAVILAYLNIFNSGTKEELMRLHGIGEKKATFIIGFREESLKPFTSLDDLQEVNVSTVMIKKLLGLM